MNEMIRRVAVATCVDAVERGVCDCREGSVRFDCAGRGRAAIEAMREPTEAMSEAMCADGLIGDEPGSYIFLDKLDAAVIWRDGIDAALKD